MRILALVCMMLLPACEDEIPNYLERASSPDDCSPPDTFHVTLRYRVPADDCADLPPEFIGCMKNVGDPDRVPGTGSSDDVPSPVCATREDGAVVCAFAHFGPPPRGVPVDQTRQGFLESDVHGTWLWLRNAIARGVLDGNSGRSDTRDFTDDERSCFAELF